MAEKVSAGVTLRIVDSVREFEQAKAIRREVFVVEQSVPSEIEWDIYDRTATHVLASVNDQPAGTARWRETGQGIKLERFAVPQSFRGRGIGEGLVRFVLDCVRDADVIYLHAQLNVVAFYEHYGFVCVGDSFPEAGIPHRKMIYLPEHDGKTEGES